MEGKASGGTDETNEDSNGRKKKKEYIHFKRKGEK